MSTVGLIIFITLISFTEFVSTEKVYPSTTESSSVIFDYDSDIYQEKLEDTSPFFTRYDINSYVIEELTRTQAISFYSQFTNNFMIASSILDASLELQVPVHLAFSIAWAESRFTPHAHNMNRNGTADHGLFQLNDSYRQSWSRQDLYDIQKNSIEGVQYLYECITYFDNIVKGVEAYNAGLTRAINNDIPESTKRYAIYVIDYESKLDAAFNEYIERISD